MYLLVNSIVRSVAPLPRNAAIGFTKILPTIAITIPRIIASAKPVEAISLASLWLSAPSILDK